MCCDDSCSDNCCVVFFVISLHLRTRQRTHFHAPTIQTNSFCFGSNKEYKDIMFLNLSVLNVSMLQWYTFKLWTVMRFCLFNNGLVCSFSVFLAKYLFFDWYYSTTDFEFIKIFLFVSKKNANTSFLDFKKWGQSFDSGTSPQEVIP